MRAAVATLPRLGAIVEIAARQTVEQRAALVVRAVFHGVLLLIFTQLWRVVLESGALDPARARDYVWYLALTEWVTLSMPHVHMRIEAELLAGDVDCRLTRPVSYFASTACETIGEVGVRLVVLAVAGAAFATLLTGGLPSDPRGLFLAVPLGLLASLALVGFQLAIAFLAFWIHDAAPVYWIFQKLLFVLGGLMLPLDVYPEWLRSVALASPFGPLVYGVGRTALTADLAAFASTALAILGWTAVAWALAWEIQRRAVRRWVVEGG